ncbi:inorganic diphosphatase [Aureimonas frigidaquae]|uniref:Inorganic pyrophosphatase n=1 Tax=Aureimonas frigidaquae TaxID=424757 RepID=A0A0N7KXQ5_9HYPH|nr:inorganic diphosphatase [Aureimonas frigidaquae]BAT27577.1 inorganic diphosphatase [Aureimonas frigidaquae]
MTVRLSAALALTLGLATSALAEGMTNPFAYPQPEEGGEFNAVIEIPAGSFTKYEIDAQTGHVIVDRYQVMPVVYPANYGSIPSSLAGDGDPLDAIVYTREPIVPGAMIRARAIGVLKMIDGGEQDDKIVAVPTSDIDPQYDAIRELSDMPKAEIDRLEAFFRVYKQLPEGRKLVELNGYEDAATAVRLVDDAIRSYRDDTAAADTDPQRQAAE